LELIGLMAKKKPRGKYYGEPEKIKTDDVCPLYLLAYADGYVMCRRQGEKMPFVIPVREWDLIGRSVPKSFQIVNFAGAKTGEEENEKTKTMDAR
jgi:hypothetical protein